MIHILLMLIFGVVPFVLFCWLVVAAIRWLNRH